MYRRSFQCVADGAIDCKEMFDDESTHNEHFAREHAKELGFRKVVPADRSASDENKSFVCILEECTCAFKNIDLSTFLMVRHYIELHRSILEICRELEPSIAALKQIAQPPLPVQSSFSTPNNVQPGSVGTFFPLSSDDIYELMEIDFEFNDDDDDDEQPSSGFSHG